mmetsp:Transcript_11841/g.21677  ORF Transcript_11841/g.21677 Transcript_11841/m.21677 type:complete len:238 (+) Transcript_11841:5540-6253(+)
MPHLSCLSCHPLHDFHLLVQLLLMYRPVNTHKPLLSCQVLPFVSFVLSRHPKFAPFDHHLQYNILPCVGGQLGRVVHQCNGSQLVDLRGDLSRPLRTFQRFPHLASHREFLSHHHCNRHSPIPAKDCLVQPRQRLPLVQDYWTKCVLCHPPHQKAIQTCERIVKSRHSRGPLAYAAGFYLRPRYKDDHSVHQRSLCYFEGGQQHKALFVVHRFSRTPLSFSSYCCLDSKSTYGPPRM